MLILMIQKCFELSSSEKKRFVPIRTGREINPGQKTAKFKGCWEKWSSTKLLGNDADNPRKSNPAKSGKGEVLDFLKTVCNKA